MTTNKNNSKSFIFKEFTALKQAAFFDKLKKNRFSGQIFLTKPKELKWTFYFFMGRIVYATGGSHPMRRWHRNIITYLPNLPSNIKEHKGDIDHLINKYKHPCWEYELLCLWVKQEKITLEQATKMIRNTITEVLFDVTQAVQVIVQLKQSQKLPFSNRLVLIDNEQVIEEAKKKWLQWQGAKIADRSPDMAPVITHPESLQKKTSPKLYQTLTKLLDGKQSLRDLSVRMKKDILLVIRSLLPYIQDGTLKLAKIPDFPSPLKTRNQQNQSNTKVNTKNKKLIACIDDSPLICQTMEKIITEADYNFLAINDPLRAISVLFNRKPDLIFLDLVMPNANGYEICTQLRKLTLFKNTPIVILTGNDGLVDRVRAKMVGSSDFMSKPIDAKIVLETIRKLLSVSVS